MLPFQFIRITFILSAKLRYEIRFGRGDRTTRTLDFFPPFSGTGQKRSNNDDWSEHEGRYDVASIWYRVYCSIYVYIKNITYRTQRSSFIYMSWFNSHESHIVTCCVPFAPFCARCIRTLVHRKESRWKGICAIGINRSRTPPLMTTIGECGSVLTILSQVSANNSRASREKIIPVATMLAKVDLPTRKKTRKLPYEPHSSTLLELWLLLLCQGLNVFNWYFFYFVPHVARLYCDLNTKATPIFICLHFSLIVCVRALHGASGYNFSTNSLCNSFNSFSFLFRWL